MIKKESYPVALKKVPHSHIIYLISKIPKQVPVIVSDKLSFCWQVMVKTFIYESLVKGRIRVSGWDLL